MKSLWRGCFFSEWSRECVGAALRTGESSKPAQLSEHPETLSSQNSPETISKFLPLLLLSRFIMVSVKADLVCSLQKYSGLLLK